MDVKIRKPEMDDFDQIFLLLEQLWPNSQLHQKELQKIFEISLESNNQESLVALTENKIIGFVSLYIKNNLWQCGNLAHIDELVVDTKYRRKGLGVRLIKEIITVAQHKKCKRIELDSAFHRTEAHSFYNSLGFENRAYLFSKKL